jgi:hypothetical protein
MDMSGWSRLVLKRARYEIDASDTMAQESGLNADPHVGAARRLWGKQEQRDDHGSSGGQTARTR